MAACSQLALMAEEPNILTACGAEKPANFRCVMIVVNRSSEWRGSVSAANQSEWSAADRTHAVVGGSYVIILVTCDTVWPLYMEVVSQVRVT